MATIHQLRRLEEKYANENGKALPRLEPPQKAKPTERTDPKFVDEGFLLCEVKVDSVGGCTVAKVCSRLELFSVTGCSKGMSLAQTAINTTSLWFDSSTQVVATGEATVIKESENYGLYKLHVQIQKWR